MAVGDFPESLSQAMLVGIMLVGGLGVGGAATLNSLTNKVQLKFQGNQIRLNNWEVEHQLRIKLVNMQTHNIDRYVAMPR